MPLMQLEELELISGVFRGRLGNAFARELMRGLSIDRINELYDRNSHLEGPDFAKAVLKDVGLEYSIGFAESTGLAGDTSDSLADLIPKGPFITISNHPCGHLDGIVLVDLLGHIRSDYKIMANQMLSRIMPLASSFISVTPTGNHRTAPSPISLSGVKAALNHLHSGGSLGLFPSGAVSDLSLAERCVRDRQWQEPVIKLIMKAGVPVVPVRFFDGNSRLYYALGLIDWRIRLLKLPSEVFNKRGQVFRIGIGRCITADEIRKYGKDLESLRDFLRASVYDVV